MITTDEPIRIAALGGSLRAGSLNRHLLRNAIELAPASCEIEDLGCGDLPPYDQSADPTMGGTAAPPPAVERLKRGLARCDGILLVSPEYNWGVPGYLKNAIDWASHPARDSVLVGRPTLLMGASTGPAGTGRAQMAWRDVLLSTRTPVLVDALQLAFAHERIATDGTLDAELRDQITQLMTLLVDEAARARDHDLPSTLRRPG